MHRGTVGIHNLNLILQNTFHPSSRGKQVAGTQFRVGDKIIQMRNNYDKNLFNGDVGFILGIDLKVQDSFALNSMARARIWRKVN